MAAVILNGTPADDLLGQLVKLGSQEKRMAFSREIDDEIHDILVNVVVISILTPYSTLVC